MDEQAIRAAALQAAVVMFTPVSNQGRAAPLITEEQSAKLKEQRIEGALKLADRFVEYISKH
jgi:hypothetical protein